MMKRPAKEPAKDDDKKSQGVTTKKRQGVTTRNKQGANAKIRPKDDDKMRPGVKTSTKQVAKAKESRKIVEEEEEDEDDDDLQQILEFQMLTTNRLRLNGTEGLEHWADARFVMKDWTEDALEYLWRNHEQIYIWAYYLPSGTNLGSHCMRCGSVCGM
jgi:hypothetical protein